MRRRLAVARDITSTERPQFARRWDGILGLWREAVRGAWFT